MGVLQLGYALVSELLLQTDPGQAPAGDGSAELQLQEVLLVQRLGVCGNGLCEVGERALLNAAAEAIKEAAAPCPQDCPLSFSMCPAPLGPVGDRTAECGGNGRCIRSQRVCDCFTGYGGDACEQCLAGFWPHKGRCVPQYIKGRNIFDPLTLEGDDKFAGLTLLVIGTVAGAAALGSLVWVLWRWLALGRVPKPVVALRRLARAMRAATIDGAAAAPPDTSVSKKHLLDVELELTGKPRRRSHAGGIEDAAAWSKRPSLRHRYTLGGAGAEAEGGDGDLLKAIRSNMLEEADGPELPPSPTKNRLSQMLGQRRTTAGGSVYSSLGGGVEQAARPSAAGAVAKRLSEVYGSIQRGVSEAGSGIARAVSSSVSRLTSAGSGYERMRFADDEGDGLLRGSMAGSELAGLDEELDSSQITPEFGRADAELPLAGADGVAAGSARDAGGLAAVDDAAPLLAGAGPSSDSGAAAAAAAAASPLSLGMPGMPRVPSWVTRADYQATLASSSSPLAPAHVLAQARGRRSPSEPGARPLQQRSEAGRVPEFVATPLSGHDATNRNAVEHFGHRMERWFSPSNPTSMDGSWSRDPSTPGGMAPLAALSSAALPEDAAAEEQAQHEAAAPAAAAAAAFNPFAPAGSSSVAAAAAGAGPGQAVAGRAPSMVLRLPVSTAAASGLGPRAGSGTGLLLSPGSSPRMLPGSWQSTGGGSHHVQSSAAAWQAAQRGVAAGHTAAAAASQPGTPGAVHVSLEHLPSLPSDLGMSRQHSGVEGLGAEQSSQLQLPAQQQQQRQHPWQAQAASGARVMSFRAWRGESPGSSKDGQPSDLL
ncbi:hypothetical protein OEZ86_011661 [Tetradesmus obliquus]|nr:hypothetical protein OEZ86_011661 [Tetradesmus obliquus]